MSRLLAAAALFLATLTLTCAAKADARTSVPEAATPGAEVPPRALLSVISVASGGWNSPDTWSSGSVPGPTDDVLVADGTVVTIDVAASCASLTVGQGSSGVLQFEAATARTLTVGGGVTIAANGTFRSNPSGTTRAHVLAVAGSLTNDGTLDFSTNGNAAGAGIAFTGAGTAVFGGTGATTDVQTITLNKGASSLNVLELRPSAFTVRGATFAADTAAGYLTHLNGTFKISGTFPLINGTYAGTGSYTVPVTGGLYLDNPYYTVAARAGSMNLGGQLRVDAGVLEVGTAPNNGIGYANTSTTRINGGTVRIAGRFSGGFPTTITSYAQTGGTMTVCMVGNTSTTLASFDLATSGSSFTMSGGSIVLQRKASAFEDYRNIALTPGPTGGTLQVGNDFSGVASVFRIEGTIPGLWVTKLSGSHTAELAAAGATVWGDVVIDSSATVNTRASMWHHLGPRIVNGGAIIGDAGAYLYFHGAGPQIYGGSGTLGTTAVPMDLLILDNPTGLTLDPASPNVITRYCVLASGTLTHSDKLQLGVGGASHAVTQIAFADPLQVGVRFDVAPTFDIGTGGYDVIYEREPVARTAGFEIPPSRTLALLHIGNPNGVTLTGGDVTVTSGLRLAGILHTGSHTVYVPSGVQRIGGHVDGNLQKDIAIGAASRTFEIGDATGYTPVTVAFTDVTVAGRVTARTDPGDLELPSGSGLDYGRSVNRHYTLSGTGGLTFGSALGTFDFLAGDVDGGADPAGFQVRRLDGMAWTPTTAGVRTATSTQASWTSGLGQFAIGESDDAPAVTVSTPNGGEVLIIGASVALTWSAADDVGVTCVDLLLSRDGFAGPWETIASCVPNTGVYPWTVTGPQTSQGAFRVVAHDGAGNVGVDTSDQVFTIVDFATATVVSVFRANPVDDGVRIEWRLHDAAWLSGARVRRSDAEAGPFVDVGGDIATEDGNTVLVDRTVEPGRAYVYRLEATTSSGQVVRLGTVSATAGVPIREFAIERVAPNPASGPARIAFAIPARSAIQLGVYDAQGREVASLAKGDFEPGRYSVTWAGSGASGRLASGVYFVRFRTPGATLTRPIVLQH